MSTVEVTRYVGLDWVALKGGTFHDGKGNYFTPLATHNVPRIHWLTLILHAVTFGYWPWGKKMVIPVTVSKGKTLGEIVEGLQNFRRRVR